MIYTKDHKQLDMFNPFAHLGPKRLALLEASWAHLFREEILHRLPVEKLFSEFDEFRGRKTKELYAMLGLVLIQQMEDCTDNDAVDNFALNLKWQYALNVTDAADVASYVSPRTLWNVRDIVARRGLEDSLFANVTDALQKLFNLDPSRQRLDSVHIFSNMAHLGRIRLFVRIIRSFLVNLRRHHPQLYTDLGEVTVRYEQKHDGAFAVKPTESAKKLAELGDDCFLLIERLKNDQAVSAMASYKHLVRLFSEQCLVENDDNSTKVVIRPSKDIASGSLQSPSDPDAGYSGHKGKGYQMQVMETWSQDKSQPDLITHVKVESASASDTQAVIPAITDAANRELAPKELLADSLYGSDENIEKAKEHGVTVVSPAMGSHTGTISLADFIFNDNDEMISCPQGQQPVTCKTGKQGGRIIHFDRTTCDHCPLQSDCPTKRVKRSVTISYDAKSLRLARRRTVEKTEAFKETYRFRAGIEATMSDLDRITGLKRLRVRGMPKVRLAATLKAAGLNIHRATAFRNQQNRRKKDEKPPGNNSTELIDTVKEQLRRLLGEIRPLFEPFLPIHHNWQPFNCQTSSA
ncbi:transposase [Trichlorobacter lovleyi]|uniref:transposase n=1 Tax=Trichlorobacter lovleyi TaxID=313985 RepID=UPI0023F3CE51|nr:transposase [Trichlorobacter lovleyi]